MIGESGGYATGVKELGKIAPTPPDKDAALEVSRRLDALRTECAKAGVPFPEVFEVTFSRAGYKEKTEKVPSALFGHGTPIYANGDYVKLTPLKPEVTIVTDPPEVRVYFRAAQLDSLGSNRYRLWLPWWTNDDGKIARQNVTIKADDYIDQVSLIDISTFHPLRPTSFPQAGAIKLSPISNWVALRDGLRRHALLIGAGLVLLVVGSAALRVSLRRRQAMERALLEENERLREVPVPSLPVLGDRWELGSKIGQGGSATVFLATDLQSPRREAVAVKILDDDAAEEEAERKRFEREVSISCRLSHPNIVRIIDYDGERDQPYLVMELLEGQPLRRRLSEGPLAPDEFRTIFRAVLDAMRYAHEQGVVHRDLKPENVILTRKGQPKIVDFGIARGQLFATVTTTGRTVGTFAYLPPERFVAAVTDDPRSDQYALGVLGYELLAGRRPWPDQMLGDVMLGIVQTRPEHLSLIRSDLPPRLPDVIERLMHLELDARYSDLREALEAFDAAWPDGV